MFKKLAIMRNNDGDTRSADHMVTERELKTATHEHKDAVLFTMVYLSKLIRDAGIAHDQTKIDQFEGFYNDFVEAQTNKSDFSKMKWYQDHVEKERHHLNSNVPDDVNLIDVIEMIADCVTAGLARSGNVVPVQISNEVLQKAVQNTINLIIDNIQVIP